MNFLEQLKAPQRQLTPTATVVRQRNGEIIVERADLLTDQQQQERRTTAEHAMSSSEQVKIAATDRGHLTSYSIATQSWQTCSNRDDVSNNVTPTTSPPPLAEITSTTELTLLTLNVWFAQYKWEQRQDGILRQLFSSSAATPTPTPPPDIVLLQEVTVDFLQRMQKDPRVQQTYRMTDRGHGSSFLGGYGNIILIKRCLPLPLVHFVKFPGAMGRRGLYIQWSNIVVSTIHLESLSNMSLRQSQLHSLCTALAGCEHVVIAGDCNVAESGQYGNEEENIQFQCLCEKYELVDVAKNLGPTYNTKKNVMVQRVTGQPEDIARYDRILSRGMLCESVALVGTEMLAAVEKGVVKEEQVDQKMEGEAEDALWMSDHFGLSWKMTV